MEAVGIAALVLSLLFVGWEIQLTREMNLADLHASRTAIEADHVMAKMESDHYLASHAVRFPSLDWDSGDMTHLERAATELSAFQQWLEYKLEYKFVELGFPTRDFEALKTDIEALCIDQPVHIAVWKKWWYYPNEREPFMRMVDQIIEDLGHDLGQADSLCQSAGNC